MNKMLLFPAFCALLLTGCGGGGADIDSDTPASVSVSGTAAIGQAVAARTVNAFCSDGKHYTSISPSNRDGYFALRLEAEALPCALEIDTAQGYGLHGFAVQAGTANITPLTDMALALNNATHGWYNGSSHPDPALLATLAGQLDWSAADLKDKLVAAGFGVANELELLDIFNGAFSVGDSTDQLLDAIGQAIEDSSYQNYPALRQVLLDNTSTALPDAPANYLYDDSDADLGLVIDEDFNISVGTGGVGCVCMTNIHLDDNTDLPITGH